MSYFAISYDLVAGKDYETLIDELERLGAVKAQLSYWLVELDNSVTEVKDHLAGFIDDDDRLMVIKFTERPRFTIAFKPASDWIKNRF